MSSRIYMICLKGDTSCDASSVRNPFWHIPRDSRCVSLDLSEIEHTGDTPDRQIVSVTGNALQMKEEWGSKHCVPPCTARLVSCIICTVPLIINCTIIRWLGDIVSGHSDALLSTNMHRLQVHKVTFQVKSQILFDF